MRVLIIGGNRFLGLELALRLSAQGKQVTLLNRGNVVDPLGARVERLIADRGSDHFDQVLEGRQFDAVVDFALFDREQAERAVRALSDRVGQYIFISTGQVYLVRTEYHPPACESDYDGPIIPCPDRPGDRENWTYGADKRAAEDVISRAPMLATTLRLPMVHGLRDYRERIASLLWRVLDGGPVLVVDPEAQVRHVYGPAVLRQIERLIDQPPTSSAAYNLAQEESVSVREVVRLIASRVGSKSRAAVVGREAMEEEGLDPVQACAFSGRWMSCLDATLARTTLGFTHEPFEVYLHALIDAYLSRWNGEPGPSMEQRDRELSLWRKRGGV
ncbi:MAG: epimerase [Candidatus Eisenbacteria bacterium]|nr:epimerase [Candidatus Eisenbacteria bacterium]MCC7143200.1 epimerase [Candidatus Eisenbacteria bacterium]